MKSFFKLFLLSITIFISAYQANAAVTAAFIKFEDPTCFGANDGYVTIDSIQTTAPTGPYTIRVNTSPATFFNVGDTVFGLGSGSYTITIVDNGDANAVLFPRPTFVINEPFQISTLILETPASCFDTCDGEALVLIGNGTPPYTVLWSDPLAQDSTTAIDLCDGQYFVTVTDNNGCSTIDSIDIAEPSQIEPNVTVTDVFCFGDTTGSAVSAPTGGSGTYTNWDWSNSLNNTDTEIDLFQGTFTVTVTDSDGCTNFESFAVDEPTLLVTSLSKTDIDCFGDSTGTINTARSGGTPPYTYAWSDGPEVTRNRTNMPAGSFTVTISDNNGCSNIEAITLAQQTEILIALTKTDILCNGDNTGDVTATVSGGSTPYSFDWSNLDNGTTNPFTISSLIAGTYVVTVTDNLNCVKIDSIEVLEPADLNIVLDSAKNPSCVGSADGTIDVIISGGTLPYTFAWSNPPNTQNKINLPAGTYTLTVTDGNLCTETFSTTLVDPDPIVPTVTTIDALCFGSSDGSAYATPTGGSGTYTTYAWPAPGIPDVDTVRSLPAGTYTVTVTDSDGCTGTESFTIGQPAAALTVSLTKSDVSCFGDTTGSINTTRSGGTPPYTYAWSDGPSTDRNRINLGAATYTVTVTDQNGCTETASETVGSRPAIAVSFTQVDNLCFGDSLGSITATISGGTPTYSFDWSESTSGTGSSSTISSLPAGTYIITITDALLCSFTDSVTLIDPAAVTANINNSVDPGCNGGTNGSATVTPGGGTGAYTYNWAGPNPPITGQGTASISSLTAGTYTVTVSDANACTATDQIILTEPAALTINTDSLALISCNGADDGFIRVSASGGTLNYTYEWPGPIFADSLANLAPGTYTVTVTDANSCTNSQAFIITEPAVLTVTLDITDEQCAGVCDGEITANPVGGTTPYTYAWSSAAVTTQTLDNLCPGTYTVTVSDNNGCTATASGTVNPANALDLVLTSTPVICNGDNTGGATALATGGAGGFTYIWSNDSIGPAINDLIAGTYTVTATDANGCDTIQSIVVDEPDSLNPTLTITDVTCGATADGLASVATVGGTGAYTFNWAGPFAPITGQGTASISSLIAGTYTVTVSDNNGCDSIQSFVINANSANFVFTDSTRDISCFGICDGFAGIFNLSGGTTPYTFLWDNFDTASTRSGLCQGNYSITISDANSCDTVVNFTINEPDSITTNLTTIDESCAGGDGEADASLASGGTPPYTYAWSGTVRTTSSIDTLTAGTYTLTITDANNCEKIESFVINPASAIDPRETIADVSCVGVSDGSIILSPSGGVAPYTYAWGGSTSTSFFRNALAAGDYIVTITDNSSPVNCVTVDTFTVAAPDTLKPTITTVDNGCGTTPIGSASVATVGGTGAYTFNWAGPTTPIIGQGTSSISGLNAGTYTLTVSDNNGCDTIQTFTINSGVSNFTFLDSIRIDSCFGACNGFAGIFNLSGGTAPYTFNWDDATALSSRSNLCAGSYTVTVSDATGCDTIVPFTITELDSISATITANPDTCVAKVGNASAVVTNGGTAPYTFDWPASGTSSGNTVDSLFPGTYQVTITGSKGCSRVKSFVIDNVAPFVINITKQDISCKSADDGEIDVSSSGGTNPLTYTWSSGTTFLLGANPRNVKPGTFTLTLTDANGCAAVRSVTVTEPDTLELDPTSGFSGPNDFTITNDSSCTAAREGSAIANAQGGTPPYTYQWGPSPPGIVNDSLITGLAAGTYFMTLTDANGCFFSTNFTIGSDAPFNVDLTSTDASCNGGTDGTISVNTTGATNPLTYNWDIAGGLSGPNPTMVEKGLYFITVTDATGCSQTSSVSVDDASAIEDSLVAIDESCIKNDGSVKAFVKGGTEPYTYEWDPFLTDGQGTDSIFNLSAGIFRVTITDAAGCTKTSTIGVSSGSDINVVSTIVRPTCFGDCDASITVSPDGGVRPYSYEWSDTTLTDSSRSNLCVGNYRVTISDGATPPCTKVEIISVTNRPILTVTEVLSFEETCDPGMDGSAAAIVEGGTPPYTYDWDAGNPNGANANFDLLAGTHTVTVTDANGCTTVEPFRTAKAPDPILNAAVTDATCNGGNDGTITVTTSLGSNPFTYNWEGGVLVGADPKNVSAGTYTLSVTDLNGCEGVTSVVVGEATPITDTLDIVDETCTPGNDGEAVASPQGGTPPYTYAWPPFGSVVGNTISGLAAGTYEVTITDDSSCTSIIPFTIGSTAPFDVTITTDSVTCHGGDDGEIRVTTTASNPTFTWALPLTGGGTTQSGLEAGSYFLTVTDGITGCRETETIIVEEPDTFLSNAVVSDVTCSGNGSDGEIDLTVSGGTSPYTYDWGGLNVEDRTNLSTGTYTVTVTDSKACQFIESFIVDDETPITIDLDSTNVTCFGGSNGTITLVTTSLNPNFVWSPSVPTPNQGNQNGLGANTYKVTVTDAITGCSATDSITINQPAEFTSSIATSSASCSPGGDGDAVATITGGTPPYTYDWGAGIAVGNSVSGLASGPYTLTVTDRRGCSETFSFSIGSSAPFTVNVINKVDPSCFGDSTGQFTINVVGAGGPLDYTWDPTFLPNQASQVGLPAGTYLLTVTDQADGCTETATIDLIDPSDISIAASIIRESCSPANDGEIDLTVTGGTVSGAYTYNWSPNTAPNQASEDQTGLVADTYLVTVTDDNGCIALDTFIVGSSAPFTVTEAKTDLDCFGDNDGTITITTSGPISGTLSYTWDPVQPNSPNLTGLSAQTYSLTITDSGNGCADTRTITINAPSEIMATAASTPESCSPGNDGSLTLTVSGGTSTGGVYQYLWAGVPLANRNNKDQTNLASGPYTVTITDDNSCTKVETFNVGVFAPFDVDLDSTDVSCNGLEDGSILVSTTASNATYAWSPNTMAGNTNNPTGLAAGIYTVTVTEPSSGCAESVSIEVNEPGTITATLTATSSTCGNADGSIVATGISGGTAPITIEWLDASKSPLIPPQTGNTASGLAAGTYFAAFSDVNNCADTLSVQVNDDLGPVATIAGTDPNCFNGCDGTATVTSACLATTCVIEWRNNSGTIIGSTATISNLCAGTYFARVTDNATNCVTNLEIIIGNGTAIEPGLITESDGCSGVTVCSGTAKSVPTGGTAPYTFNWSGPSSPIVGQGTDSISELCAGNYDLTITDANGCDTLLSFVIDPKSLILPNADPTNETCAGANDGIIALAPTGGEEPYTYNWSPVPANGQGVDTATGLSAQSYSVTITDDNGCDTSISIVINSGSFVYSIAKTDLSCNSNPDGTAAVTIFGGNTGYSFNWNPAPGLGQGTANASAMNSGEYFVTISSATGCSAIDSVTINPSSSILPNEVSTDELCSGVCNGTITLNASGGAGAPYTYNWSPVPPNGQGVSNATGLCSGDYDITVTDASGCDTSITITISGNTILVPIITTEDMSCNNSNPCDGFAFVTTTGGLAPYTYDWSAGSIVGADGDTAQVLCEGSYFLTVTDANGCSLIESFSISAPPAITASFTSVNSTCNLTDGSITVTGAGGASGFSYEWFDSGLNSLGITTPTISAIASGIYFVEVTDGTGCVERFSTALSDDGGEVVTTSQTNVTCFGGSDGTAKASYICGDPSCVVAWFNGNALPLNVTIDSVDNLSAGTYFVQVTNNSGCNTFEEVIITEPDEYNLTATIIDAGCNNDCNGSISVNVTGGTGTITYNWAPGPLVGQGTNAITTLCAGNYSLTVSDDNGCDSVFSFTVGEPAEFVATFTFAEANCGLADGSITADINGGTVVVDYNYQWFDGTNNLLVGETNNIINNIGAGAYFLRVRDDNVCEERFTAVLGNTNGPEVVVDSTRESGCFGENDGAVFITATGNNVPFDFDWLSQGQKTEDITDLVSGTYTVQVTDALGCTTVETATVLGSTQLTATFDTDDASCGLCDGEASITMSGGTSPYTYLWSNGSIVDTTANLCGGAHSVIITDANGCSITESFSINTTGGPTGERVTVTASSCATSCDGTVTVQPVGGTQPYTYLWQHNGATTNSLTGLCKGTYFLQVSDVKGCSRNVRVEIDSPNELVINDQVTGTKCNTTPCEGIINLSVSGGVKPYNYVWGPTPQIDTNFVSGLCAGIYNVTVSDANGCSETKTITISNDGATTTPSPTATDANCFATCDGSLISNVTPSANVTFRWFDDQGLPIAAADVDVINSVCAGEYFLEVTSLPANCKSYTTVVVEEPDSITLAASIVKNISCAESCDGEVFISSQGGIILFEYSWSDPNSQTEVPATDLCAGTYTVTATDANGCSATSSVTLVDPPILTVSISGVTGLNCSSDCDGSATALANGGVAPYNYDWDGGQSGANPTNLCFGPNVLTVTDATGCMIMDTVLISATDTVVAQVPTNPLVCGGDSIYLDGTILGSTVNFIGWYEDDTTTLITNSADTVLFRPVGEYTFYLIASNGSCSDTTEYKVRVVPSPMLGVVSPISIFKDEVANMQVSNQDPTYLYNWNPGTDLTDSTIAEPISSTRETIVYTLTVRDTNNCTYIDSVKVIYSPNINIPSGFSPNGDGKNDVWRINILEEFPNAKVQVYNRWGELLYEQANGYVKPWDGTYSGEALPIGTYYYVVDFNSDRFDPVTGPITIVR